MQRRRIDPGLELSFDQVYQTLTRQSNGVTPQLETTGGVPFVAEAKVTRDGRRFISLPHNNRIYEGDWGFQTNGMGQDGQRIGHYSIPLDEWVARQLS